jgi:hypothetical protein
MEDTEREPRVSGTTGAEQTEETRAQEAPAAVGRLLANPRRVRVN